MEKKESSLIYSIHYLRGIAALLVFMYHTRGLLNNTYAQRDLGSILFGNGYFGVDLFFMVSGFVIYISTNNSRSMKSFYVKRFFRIFPLYWVCLLSFLIINIFILNKGYGIDILKITKSIFLIPLDFDGVPPFFGFSIITTAWTLTYEIVFYIIFSISMMVSHKYRAELCSIFIFIMIITLYFLSSKQSLINPYSRWSDGGVLSLLSSPMFFEFVMGMVAAKIYNIITKEIATKIYGVLICLLLFSISGIFLFNGHGPMSIGIPCFILLVSLSLIEKVNGFKKIMILSLLGDISYSFYISHPISLLVLNNINPIQVKSGMSLVVMQLSFSILISFILYSTVEKWSIKKARHILNS